MAATYEVEEENGGLTTSPASDQAPSQYMPPVSTGKNGSPVKIAKDGTAITDGIFKSTAATTDLLLNQQPNRVNGFPSDASCDKCKNLAQSIAENFSLNVTKTIGQIIIRTGYYSNDMPVDPDHLTFIFHNFNAGIPGDAIDTQTDVPYTRVQTGATLSGFHEWMHTLTLSNPVHLTPGNYWVEIYNDTGFGTDDFFWEPGDADTIGNGLDGIAYSTSAPGSGWNYDYSDNIAIQLYGVRISIPWLSEVPQLGSISAGANQIINLDFDAGAVTQIGLYDGILHVLSNDPINPDIAVPIAIEVTTIPPPAAFGKSSPNNSATGQTTSLALSWNATSPVTYYKYCYATTTGCSNWINSGTATSADISGLNYSTTYFWQMRAWKGTTGPGLADSGSY